MTGPRPITTCSSKTTTGRRLGGGRLPEGVEGVARFHELRRRACRGSGRGGRSRPRPTGACSSGRWSRPGYTVLAVNPLSTSRYRERHSTSGAKSDPGDARVLAELARTDAHNHRPVAGDSDLAEAVKVLARAHQSLIWTRQRQTNQLRSTLREFYPAALDAFDDLGRRRRAGRAGDRADPDAGPAAVAFEDRRRRCGAVAANDASRNAPSRSRRRCGPSSSQRRRSIADAMGATVTALVAVIAELDDPDRPARDRAGRPF